MKIPTVDLKTKKISNAKKDTYEYYHEEAHLEYSDKFGFLVYFQEQLQFWAMLVLAVTFFINQFKYVALGMVLLMIILFAHEEFYCDWKAKERENKPKHLNS